MAFNDAQVAAIERALTARKARREGRELRFVCPAHKDTDPSARWNPDNQTWYCDACTTGGGWSDLAIRLGIELGAAGDGLAQVEAVYDYRGRDGRLLFQVLRKRDKRFSCRRPLGDGNWAWNLSGVERATDEQRAHDLLPAMLTRNKGISVQS